MIPRVIHYCWFGNATKPRSVLKCIESWKKYCPDYEIIQWTEKEIDIAMNQYTKEAYDLKAWGFVPDYLRLWIIYTYGGIYLDTDVQIIKGFDPLLKYHAFAGMETYEFVNFGSGFGAEPGNEIIKEHMEMYDQLHFVNEDGTLNRLPSPFYTTEIMKRHGFEVGKEGIQNAGDFVLFPSEYFCPKNYATGITTLTKNTFSIHQFDSSWLTEEEQMRKKNRWKKGRIDVIVHTPNRLFRRLLGDTIYDNIKKAIKGFRSRHSNKNN